MTLTRPRTRAHRPIRMSRPESGSDGEIPVSAWIATFPPDVARLTREVRAAVKAVAPRGKEQAYRGWSMRVRTDRGLISFRGSRGGVSVTFSKGAALKDPAGLLGGGRVAKIREVAEARSGELRDLLRQELRTGPVRMTVEKGEGKRIFERIRAICLSLPEVTERLSHGAPSFFVRDAKQFAQVWTDHHGDGRYALWCAAPAGAQPALVHSDPERFFVPPYVGQRGWLGVRLDRGVDWTELRAILEDAHVLVAGSRYAQTDVLVRGGSRGRPAVSLRRTAVADRTHP